MADFRSSRRPEGYLYRDNSAFEAYLASRTASREASFFLPYLRSGMRLLDVGCGPGTITLGLAEVVAPGEVVGIDLQATQVEQARALAAERGVRNMRFAVGDGYRLPFADDSFDAVFSHVVMMHLQEPVRALVEMRRVLRPGGVAGISDVDVGTTLLVPETPALAQWLPLWVRVKEHHGTDAFVGRHHRRRLLEAGFARAEASASVESAGSLKQTRRYAAVLKAMVGSWAQTAMAERWVDEATMDAIMTGIDVWAERPDAFLAWTHCAAVAWKNT